MRFPVSLIFQLLSAACSLSAGAAVIVQTPTKISVDGIINGGLIAPGDVGDTLDYLTFQLLSPGTVTTTIEQGSGRQVWLGRYVGLENRFDYNFDSSGDPLQHTLSKEIEGPASFTLLLDPGIYVVVIGNENREEDDNQIYQIDYGYLSINPYGDGFDNGGYKVSVEGDIRGMEFRDGELNGSFIVTNLVPEPSSALLLAAGTCLSLRRRRRGQRQP